MAQTLVPVLVLSLGGTSLLIGIVVALLSVPSVVFRPLVGRFVDRWGARRAHLLGAVGLAVATTIYLIPSLATVVLGRFVNGAVWAAFSTAGSATLADIATVDRRGSSAMVYTLMPSVAAVVSAPLGLLLLQIGGLSWSFLCSAGLALLSIGPIVATSARTRLDQSAAPGTSDLIERNALLPMAFEILFALTGSLFLIFPPVFAAAHGYEVTDLTLYYFVFGAALVTSRVGTARLVDRFSRGATILAGAFMVILALVLASWADTPDGLAVAGVVYALGTSGTFPISMALAMDRAPAGRSGATMATFSLGYQVGLGSGAVIWGLLIELFGFPAPFAVAAVVQVVVIGVVVARRRELGTQARLGRAG